MPIVLLAGLPGTGKSALASALAAHFRGHVLNKDILREATFGPDYVLYETAQDEFVHEYMIRTAQWLLERDPQLWIFFDGRTYSRREQREKVAPHYTIECVAPAEVVRGRLTLPHPAKNRNWALYEKVRKEFEPITEPHLQIDTGQPLSQCLSQAITYLEAAQ